MKKSVIGATVVSAIISLASCAGSPIMNRVDAAQSKTAYKSCLAANPSDPNQCEAQRKMFEADMETLKATEQNEPTTVVVKKSQY